MLSAVVVNLRPVAVAHLPFSHGTFAYAAALELFLRQNPTLARTLHEMRPYKPFTVSPLLNTHLKDDNGFILSPQETYSWRLTGLIEEVSQYLLSLSPASGGVRIGDAVFTIDEVIVEKHPETGQVTYEELWKRWGEIEPKRMVTFHFVTPTTFRSSRFEEPFPLPKWVFGSLLEIWNTFSTHPIGQIKGLFEEVVLLSNWKGETRRVELGGYRTVGFIGKFTYRFTEPTQKLCQWASMLSEFAFYSGVGWQTTHGLGQVRVEFR